MYCRSCKSTMPFVEDEPYGYDCIYCAGRQVPDAADLLSQPALGFVNEIRKGQISLAEEVTEGIRHNKVSLFEAGTGVGKSFAYLLPAIISGKRIVISTAKVTLQTQLLEKDLPYIQSHLNKLGHPSGDFAFFGAYGKNRYACYTRCKREKQHDKANWPNYETFFNQSDYGRWDDADKLHLRLDQSLSAEHCIGASCSYYKQCGYIKARNNVAQAQIVVTNNWLLGMHYKCRDELNISLLGPFEHLIVDEAHKIEDGIRQAYTYETRLDQPTKIQKAFDDLSAHAAVPLELPELQALQPAWDLVFQDLQRVLQSGDRVLPSYAEMSVADTVKWLDAVLVQATSEKFITEVFGQKYNSMQRYLQSVYAAKGVNPTTQISTAPVNDATGPAAVNGGGVATPQFNLLDQDQERLAVLEIFLDMVKESQQTFEALAGTQKNRTWDIDTTFFKGQQYLTLKSMPVNIGCFMPKKDVTYLSATLALENNFDVFAGRVGVTNIPYQSEVFPSPFDITKQALLYIPKTEDVPEPVTQGGFAQDNYRDKSAEVIRRLLTANRGDAFVLFTSRAEMLHVQRYLDSHNYPYPFFTQDGMAASDVLARFKATPQSSILGVKSFWEGIDVPGDKLFLVIITKLPFPNFKDRINSARKETYSNFGVGFNAVDVPEMLFDLRQGVGRLIRTQKDRGLIALLDTRVLDPNKRYRKRVFDTLGLHKYHSSLDAVCKGLENRAR